MTQHNFDCPVIEGQKQDNKKTLQVMSWEFLFAIGLNLVIGVWFIASSQGEQDVTLATHEARIERNERMVSAMSQQSVDIAKMQEQLAQMKKGQEEIKVMLSQLNTWAHDSK